MIDMGVIIINSYAFGAAAATAGITTSIVSDGDSDGDLLGTSNNFMSDGEILQVQYSGSGGSSVTYTVTRSGTGMSIGTLSDVQARNAMFVLAYKDDSNMLNGSDVTLSGSSGAVHTTIEETGTFFLKVQNATGSNFDVVINQNVDSGAATATATITVVDNS
tara:strand:+ start:316 stop:801 length:486 start_codon:yes stop_codon:yes gene_type:complete